MKGNVIIPNEFEDIQGGDGFFLVSKNEKQGLFDYKGKVIVPAEYESLDWENGFIVGTKDGEKRRLKLMLPKLR